jgi:hypothetical protein
MSIIETTPVLSPLGVSQLLPPAGSVEPTQDETQEVIENVTVTVPSCVEPSEDGRPWTVKLYKGNCLKCDALINDEESELEGVKQKCHFKNGNDYCPAKGVAIEFVGVKVIALSNVRKAQAKGPAALLTALRMLDEKHTAEVRDHVMRELGLVPLETPAPSADGSIDVSNI